ncbi:hypothetical protein HELRODRAFT_182312 [Helobdella robusta]|uniref:Uncharacterized protein n=1 Tax=Helobdella robusta TaxID=6412 RepID=T1FI16_HELRO|nr:hypothetical protein HELRODRAFT_182312 [Helobdella robusta]ESN91061.1 hypothetical protein HELRODRAFT_182312 [Helobdella robusta]
MVKRVIRNKKVYMKWKISKNEEYQRAYRSLKQKAKKISVDSGEYELANKTVSDELYLHASQLMKADVALYKEKIENQKKQGWLKTVLSKGTSKDKVAAWVVLIQDSHLHNFCYLDSLISLLVKERRKALETLVSREISDMDISMAEIDGELKN